MPPDPFSLLDATWLPVLRASGARQRIRPTELTLGIDDDPIVAFDWPRADLDAAAREFAIGLVSTACWRHVVDDWEDWWERPPDPAALDACFEPFRDSFFLDGPGPRFLQDLEPLDGEAVLVSALLIDSPGANALKRNTDLFVKRGRVAALSRAAAAMALFALQAHAPAGGAGHRTSLRGGGPLVTLLLPGSGRPDEPVPLWYQLWTNVFWDRDWADPAESPECIFPWLGPTRTSEKDQVTTPEDVHPAQAYWGMPRRIRLDFETNSAGTPCDLTGEVDAVAVRSYRTRRHGQSYAAWSRGHPLTPYYRSKPTDPEWLPVHPQPDRLGYRDWLGLILGDDADAASATRAPARAVVAAAERLSWMPREVRFGARLHAAGYDVDKMKARGLVESGMPVRIVAEAVREDFEALVRQLIRGAREAQAILGTAIRTALWGREAPDEGTGERGLARDRFWEETEQPFHEAVAAVAAALEAGSGDEDAVRVALARAREGWHDRLRRTVIAIFDALVPLDRLEDRRFERIVDGRSAPGGPIAARRNLLSALAGHGKSGAAYYTALGLPPREPAAGGRKGRKAA